MSRKGENIYKRKDGRWEGRVITERGKNGHVKFYSIYGKSYNEVKEKKKMWLSDNNVSISKTDGKITLNEIAELWLLNKKIYVKPSTFTIYDWHLKAHILPFFGSTTIDEIKESEINQFFLEKLENGRHDKKGGLSKKTIKDMQIILKDIFKFAAKQYDIKNPCENLTFPRIFDKEIKVLSKCDKIILTEYLLNNCNSCNIGILLSLFTGMRIGEVCAIKWKNIDFELAVINVNATAIRVRTTEKTSKLKTKVIVHEPKSTASKRVIPIPNFIFEKMKSLYCPDMYKYYILSNLKNKCMEPRTYQNIYKSILRNCNIEYINYHSLRHSFASMCIQKGVDAKTLSEVLGHSNVNITLNRYVHVSLEQKREQMEKLFLS